MVERFHVKLTYNSSYVQKNREILDSLTSMKRSDYGLPEDKFLFACFNQLYKMDPEIFSTWLAIILLIFEHFGLMWNASFTSFAIG